MIHKLIQSPHSFHSLFLPDTLPIYVIVFIASLNANVNSGVLDAKNEKKNRTDSSACVCPLGWERWVNKGKKEKHERIQQRSRSFASSGFVITMEADTFPLLISWDEDPSGGNMVWQNSGRESHVEVRRCD